MEKRVLVTGANGLLGQKLANKLMDRPNMTLLATGSGPSRNPYLPLHLYAELDITDRAALKRVIDDFKPTDIINSAAMTQVDACEHEPDKCHAINVAAVEHMAQLCKEHDIRLIHISTDFIFDGEDGPYDERGEPNPLSTYGHSKWLAEERIQEISPRWAIIRTVLVYGTVPDLSRSNIVLWVKAQLEAGKQIKVVNDQVRSPTLAEDLADGIIAVLMRDKTGLYHISGAEIMNVWDIAQRTAKFFGLDTSLIVPTDSSTLSQPAKRPPRTGFVILKAQTELDYKPHTFEQGLRVVQQQLETGA